MTWGRCHGGDVMVLNLHFVMVSQQFVMGLSLVATFHYAQITTFVGISLIFPNLLYIAHNQ